MGVSGCGKSTIGKLLSDKLAYAFLDGDDFHSKENVEKMRQAIPLTDSDRQDWLKTLAQVLQSNTKTVLACSALKPSYRDILKQGNHGLSFIYLKGTFEEIWERHQQREGHYFMGQEMLESQFKDFIEPEENEAIVIRINQSPENILREIIDNLSAKVDSK